ncbi:MAG TPA: hypothetical protein VMH81_10045 [Bryobacteraceae bacterium]|nr:hypothetical protein [Bryobacteraceae bacterium]
MNDAQFQDWMKQLAEPAASEPPTASAIWWRAQLRGRLETRAQSTRPIRVAELAVAIACWLAAAVVSAGLGPSGLAAFIAISVAIGGGFAAIALKEV